MGGLRWEPGQPKHGFEGLYGVGDGGYQYRVELRSDHITVREISTHFDCEVITRYAYMDRDLDAARRFTQRWNDEDKPNVAWEERQHSGPGMMGRFPGRMDFRTKVRR